MSDSEELEILETIKKRMTLHHESLDEQLKEIYKQVKVQRNPMNLECVNEINENLHNLSVSVDGVNKKITKLQNLWAIENDPLSKTNTKSKFTTLFKYGGIFALGCLATAILSSLWIHYDTRNILSEITFNKLSAGTVLIKAWPTLNQAEREKIVKEGWK